MVMTPCVPTKIYNLNRGIPKQVQNLDDLFVINGSSHHTQ